MKVFVIMGNDFPTGVLDDEAAAEKLCEKRNAAQKRDRKLGDGGGPRIYWRFYPFEIGEVES